MVEKLKVIIDSREPKSVINYLTRYHSKTFDFEIAALPEGDFLSTKVIVERKTIMDLYSSIKDGRFSSQINRIATHTDKIRIILITGNLKEECKKMRYKNIKCNEATVIKAIASALVRYQMFNIWCEDTNSALRTMLAIMEGVHEGKTSEPMQMYPTILMSVYLGIPRDAMQTLIEKYGSVEKIINVPLSELIKIKGIGKKRAEKLKKRLTEKIQ